MGNRAFLIAGSCAALIANDNTDFRYRAQTVDLSAGELVPVQRRDEAETQFMVECGVVEFMVGGAESIALPGDFVRVAAGTSYAYRNFGETPARVLVRTVSPIAVRRAVQITAEFAA